MKKMNVNMQKPQNYHQMVAVDFSDFEIGLTNNY